jgi:flotillin
MISSSKSEVGAAKLTGEVMDIVSRVPEMVHKMTGIDVAKVG